jgi:hypothetical protein
MFVLLNVAMGGNLGGSIDPSLRKVTMEVDYLAHCTATNQNNAQRCNENTPAVYADDDNDGIENSLDQCPNTPSGESVDEKGCFEEIVNISPEVSLSITQNNVTVSSVDISGGLVTLSANATDENADDILSYVWLISGTIPSPIIDGGLVIFDPSSMAGGNSYQVELTVTDNGNPRLSVSNTIKFSVNNMPLDAGDDEREKSSGGLFSYLLLLMLIVFRQKYLQH